MNSLLSDLLDAAVSGARKPTNSSAGDSATNPEFAAVLGAELSSPDTVTTMETQNMIELGSPSDLAGVSPEMPAQVASSDAVAQNQAAGETFEAIKESLQEPPIEDLMAGPAIPSDQVVAEGATPASTPVRAFTPVNAATVNIEIDSDVMLNGLQGENEVTAQGAQPLSKNAPSADDALAFSMMAAGQGSRVSHQLSNRPVTAVSTGTTAAGSTFNNMTGALLSIEGTSSNLQEPALSLESKIMDAFLSATREPTRFSQPEFVSDQRPVVAAPGTVSGNTAISGETATKQSGFIEQPLDFSQSNKQQQATEMATYIRVLRNQGGGEAKVNLHPAELGRMSIAVTTEGNETKVAFTVETSQARQAVEASLPRLREMLEQAGLSLADSDVSEQSRQSRAEDESAFSQSRGRKTNEADETSGAALSLSVRIDPERLLDTYV